MVSTHNQSATPKSPFRARSLGVRLALGTTPGRLRSTVLRRMLIVVACGLAPGVAAAVWVTHYYRDLIRGADLQLPATLVLAVLIVAIVAAIAVWLGTWRIVRLDIMAVLRAETAD